MASDELDRSCVAEAKNEARGEYAMTPLIVSLRARSLDYYAGHGYLADALRRINDP
jgi:hypothetical protein